LQTMLTRDKLEELTSDLIDRTVEICARTLEEAEIQKANIEDVILVGGMTRMPRVQQMVAEFFGLEPCKGVHPDEVVALGAAIQGAALMDEKNDVLLLDVTPHSLGIMIVGGYFHKLIEQNTTVPTSKSHVFTTVKDHQSSVRTRSRRRAGCATGPARRSRPRIRSSSARRPTRSAARSTCSAASCRRRRRVSRGYAWGPTGGRAGRGRSPRSADRSRARALR